MLLLYTVYCYIQFDVVHSLFDVLVYLLYIAGCEPDCVKVVRS